jgi:periplasmic divalent cation tolerance protein
MTEDEAGLSGNVSACVCLYTTFPTQEEAERIAHALVAAKVCACVNLLRDITSVYVWEGTVHQATEVAALIKTTDAQIEAVNDLLTELHPYKTPAVMKLIGGAALPATETWIRESVGE